jgi:hypothetical protein
MSIKLAVWFNLHNLYSGYILTRFDCHLQRTDDMLPSHMHLSPPPPQSVTRNDFDDFAKFASGTKEFENY